jgi:hypothetical protein
MFDRAFFEQHFQDQVRAFAREHRVARPVVELLLDDGTAVYVRSVLQTRESWLALSVWDADGPRQLFCPYYGIRRITLYAKPPKGAPGAEAALELG